MPARIEDASDTQRCRTGAASACGFPGGISRSRGPLRDASREPCDAHGPGTVALAEDLAQEAFARAFERLSTYDQQRRFVSWFFQILHNVTVDYLRRKRPNIVSLPDGLEEAGHPVIAPSAPSGQPDAQAEQAALARAMDAALAQVRPEYREAIVLRYREDLSVQEIADAMSLPEGTVKTYLYRARKELATILSAQGWATASADEK